MQEWIKQNPHQGAIIERLVSDDFIERLRQEVNRILRAKGYKHFDQP